MEVFVLTSVALAIIGVVLIALIFRPAMARNTTRSERTETTATTNAASVNIRDLVGHLAQRARRDLEAAAGFTLARTHHDVDVEHWLLKMLEPPSDELARALEHCQVDVPKLTAELSAQLARFKTGAKRPPALSQDLVDWIDSAWTSAVNEFGSLEVNTCTLLYALLKDPRFEHYRQALPSLRRADPQTLRPFVPVVSEEIPPNHPLPSDAPDPRGLRALIGKLSPTSRRTLEAAAGLTAAYKHFDVDIAHWLLAILRDPDEELTGVLGYFEVPSLSLETELQTALSRLRTGSLGAPALSDDLVRLLEVAWECAEQEFTSSEVSQCHLLYALVHDECFVQQRERVATLQAISADKLRAFLAG